jgi:hypothetical protein
MIKRVLWLAPASSLLFAGAVLAQHPIVDKLADRVVQKYQQSSCEQLWIEKEQKQGQPKPPEEQRMLQLMREDPQMRAEFINRVAAPVANKMFECGMIP